MAAAAIWARPLAGNPEACNHVAQNPNQCPLVSPNGVRYCPFLFPGRATPGGIKLLPESHTVRHLQQLIYTFITGCLPSGQPAVTSPVETLRPHMVEAAGIEPASRTVIARLRLRYIVVANDRLKTPQQSETDRGRVTVSIQ